MLTSIPLHGSPAARQAQAQEAVINTWLAQQFIPHADIARTTKVVLTSGGTASLNMVVFAGKCAIDQRQRSATNFMTGHQTKIIIADAKAHAAFYKAEIQYDCQLLLAENADEMIALLEKYDSKQIVCLNLSFPEYASGTNYNNDALNKLMDYLEPQKTQTKNTD